ncbi:hypothetical protein BBK82_34625 [Lentzea guizhouensis]|uniref:Integral membrane protein n=1 Tax=Lentzea guizhouensis TaxID=1586287 RepID=A0A1B2HRN2_9PSEU|nr:hypothetical protein BBK82_34625 [Lentzea guizhouensis]
MRGAAAVVALPAGVAAVAAFAQGTAKPSGGGGSTGGFSGVCGLPSIGPLGRGGSVGSLGVTFSAPVGPVVLGAVGFTLAVVGACWLAARFRLALRGPLWTVAGLAAVGLVAALVVGDPAVAGGGLLLFPTVVFGAVLLGFGLPWTLHADGALACALDGVTPPSPVGLTWWWHCCSCSASRRAGGVAGRCARCCWWVRERVRRSGCWRGGCRGCRCGSVWRRSGSR